MAELPRDKIPSRSSSRSSSRQSSSPQSTLSGRSSGRSSQNSPLGRPAQNGVAPTTGRLTRSLSTTNLSSPTGLSYAGSNHQTMRAPKGFMEKFIASRGKMTPSPFSGGLQPSSGKVVMTRPMKVQPKVGGLWF